LKRNSRLSLAFHTLAHMASDPERSRTSADIAAHAGTNPVVVRRVLGRLREAGLLISERGHAGGWRLARPPEQVSLADIYRALDERLVLPREERGKSDCAVEHALQHKVLSVMEEIEESLTQKLAAVTIQELGSTPHHH